MTKYLTQSNLLTCLCVGLIISTISIAAPYFQSPAIDAVLNGEAHLECHMHDGIRIIDTHKIVEHFDGVWLFEDGHAKQCRIIQD